MKKFIVICALIAIGSTSEDIFFSQKLQEKPIFVPSVTLHNGSFSPKLDHFNPQDTRTVEFVRKIIIEDWINLNKINLGQNYRLNLDFYREGGPLFIYINDGEQYTTEWVERGLVVDVARNVGGAVITSDHRYFRLNTPTEWVYNSYSNEKSYVKNLLLDSNPHLRVTSSYNFRNQQFNTFYDISEILFKIK